MPDRTSGSLIPVFLACLLMLVSGVVILVGAAIYAACLHSPQVPAMVPSTSMNASLKNPSGCTSHTLSRARLRNWRRVRIAHNAKHAKQFFTVTHRFHPWRGRRFELINCERRWGQWRVFYVNEEGSLASLPASWIIAPTGLFLDLKQDVLTQTGLDQSGQTIFVILEGRTALSGTIDQTSEFMAHSQGVQSLHPGVKSG